MTQTVTAPQATGRRFARIWAIALFALLCYATVWSVLVAMNDAISFDGAMNVQVSQNLAEGRGYQTSYGSERLFDHRIQTGATYILPVAVLFRLFGPKMELALLVNSVFIVLLLGSVSWLVVRRTRSCCAACCAVLFILLNAKLREFGFGGYGEVICLSLCVLGMCLLEKMAETGRSRWALGMGVCLALAYLAKTVALVPIGGVLAGFALGLLPAQKRRWRQGAMLAAGIVVPVLAFEVFRLASLGAAGYLPWWQEELGLISKQAGTSSGFQDTAGLGPKLAAHWQMMVDGFALMPLTPILLLGLTVLIWPMLFLRDAARRRQSSGAEIAIWISLLVFLVWWMVITPTQKAYARRLLDGMLLVDVGSVLVAMSLWRRGEERNGGGSGKWIHRVAVAGLIVICAADQAPELARAGWPLEASVDKVQMRQLAREMRRLHDMGAVLYGYDWWQAPVAALMADVPILDLLGSTPDTVCEKASYLIADRYMTTLAPSYLEEATTAYQRSEVFHVGGNQIFRLSPGAGVVGFSDDDRKLASSSVLLLDSPLTNVAKGVYAYEPDAKGRWMSRSSAYLLKRSGQSHIEIRFWTPDPSKYADSSVSAAFRVNGRESLAYPINRDGAHRVVIPLPTEEPDDVVVELAVRFSSQVKPGNGDVRDLAAVLTGVSLAGGPPTVR